MPLTTLLMFVDNFVYSVSRMQTQLFLLCPAELQTLQVGESRYPGNDSEALEEPAARADER